MGKGRDKGVCIYALVRDRCVKAAAVSKVRFVGVAREDYAGRSRSAISARSNARTAATKQLEFLNSLLLNRPRRREAAGGQTNLLFDSNQRTDETRVFIVDRQQYSIGEGD